MKIFTETIRTWIWRSLQLAAALSVVVAGAYWYFAPVLVSEHRVSVKQDDVVDELYGDLFQKWNRLMVEARDLRASGQYDEALPKLRQILNLTPFHLPTVEALAEAHEKLGQTEAAEKYRRRAEQLRPPANS